MSSTTTFTTKVGSRLTPLRATLRDANGPINLTSAQSVSLILEHRRTGATALNAACTIESPPTAGVVTYSWTVDDVAGVLASVADYRAEFLIQWSPTNPQRVPSDGFFTVQVIRNAEM